MSQLEPSPLCTYLLDAAADHPSHAAVRGGADRANLTWKEVEQATRRLATALIELGVTGGERVAFYMPKSSALVTTIFATLMAGGTYVPLDPQQPAERAARILADAEPKVLVTTAQHLAALPTQGEETPCGCAALIIDEPGHRSSRVRSLAASIDQAPRLEHPVARGLDDLAAILFTSGSTGTPKGVMISHGNLHNFISWARQELLLGSNDVFSNHAGFHFDLSTFDLMACAASAGTLWLIPEKDAYNAQALINGILEHGVTVWYSVPSVLTMLVDSGALNRETARTLRYVLFAGEVFPIKHLRRLGETLLLTTELYNFYGPTETNVCTYFKVGAIDPDRTQPVPIGRAIAGAELEVIDADGTRVETGDSDAIGELVVRGRCVTPGYWRRQDDPNCANHREGCHATGDLVSFEGGELIYRGRKDRMVKLHGYRVELGEIEAVLAAHPAVAEAAVIATTDDQSTRLVAFCSASTEQQLSLLQMKSWCATRLPRYMIPNLLRKLPALPKTPNGKIDVRHLQSLWTAEAAAS